MTDDDIRRPAPCGFVVITMVEHIALFRIILGQPLPQVEEPLHVVAPLAIVQISWGVNWRPVL